MGLLPPMRTSASAGSRVHLAFRIFGSHRALRVRRLHLPSLDPLRTGGYKGLLVDGLMVPMLTLGFACRAKKPVSHLAWDPRAGWIVAEAK